jgi:hypothetical protein
MPAVTAMVVTRRKNSRLICEALKDNVWLADVAANLTIKGSISCIRVWEEIAGVSRNKHESD